MHFIQRYFTFFVTAFLLLVQGDALWAVSSQPQSLAESHLGAQNLSQVRVPPNQVLVVKLTKNLRIVKLADGASFVLETAPGGTDVLVSVAQSSILMTYPGGLGGLVEFTADQALGFGVRLNQAVDVDSLTDLSEFDSTLDGVKCDRLITFNSSSAQHWEGLILFGLLSGSLINTFGFKLLASGLFDKGPQFASYAGLIGVLATFGMTVPMALILRKQATKGPVKTWKKFATAAIVAGGLGICAGTLGLIGSAFGR